MKYAIAKDIDRYPNGTLIPVEEIKIQNLGVFYISTEPVTVQNKSYYGTKEDTVCKGILISKNLKTVTKKENPEYWF